MIVLVSFELAKIKNILVYFKITSTKINYFLFFGVNRQYFLKNLLSKKQFSQFRKRPISIIN